MQRTDNQAAENEAKAFIEIEPDENQGTGGGNQSISQFVINLAVGEKPETTKTEESERPHERHQIIIGVTMMLKSKEQVLERMDMTWNV